MIAARRTLIIPPQHARSRLHRRPHLRAHRRPGAVNVRRRRRQPPRLLRRGHERQGPRPHRVRAPRRRRPHDGRELPRPLHRREGRGPVGQAPALQGQRLPPHHPRVHGPGRRLHGRQRHGRREHLRPHVCRRELHRQAHRAAPALHGQRRAQHQRIPVLHCEARIVPPPPPHARPAQLPCPASAAPDAAATRRVPRPLALASQTFAETPWLDGKHTVFGKGEVTAPAGQRVTAPAGQRVPGPGPAPLRRQPGEARASARCHRARRRMPPQPPPRHHRSAVVAGDSIVREMEAVGTQAGTPRQVVVITDCGEIERA